jgi:hypothetical protein
LCIMLLVKAACVTHLRDGQQRSATKMLSCLCGTLDGRVLVLQEVAAVAVSLWRLLLRGIVSGTVLKQ